MKQKLAAARLYSSNILIYWFKVIQVIFVRFIREGFTYRVSALTYTTLLAIVPIFAVLFSFLSLFHVFHNLGDRIQHYIFTNFVPATGKTLETYFSSFTTQAIKLPPVGIIALIVISIMLMLTIDRTLNDVWYVKVRRRGVVKFLLYWAIITIGPICIGLSFVVSSYIFSFSFLSRSIDVLGLKKILLDISPFLLTAVGLTVLNMIVPNCRVKFRYAFLGGVLSAIFFELAKHGFAEYAYYMSSYRLIYGAIAIIPLFLVWIYISWFIILAGAILAHAAATTEKHYKGRTLPALLHSFLILRELWDAQKAGDDLSLKEVIDNLKGSFELPTDIVLQNLVKIGLIKRTDGGGYILAFDTEFLTLYDLVDKLECRIPRVEDISAVRHVRLEKVKAAIIKFDESLEKQFHIPLSKLF